MSDDPESKTETASEKKIHDAIEKGNVPFSREVPIFASILGLLVVLVFSAREQTRGLVAHLVLLIEQPRSFSLDTGEDATRLLHALALEMGLALLPALLVLLTGGLAASVFQNMPRLVGSRIQPKWSRISPAAGWKRIFGLQGHIEFAKSVFKFAMIGAMSALVLRSDHRRIVAAMYVDPLRLPDLLLTMSVRLVAAVSAATIMLVAGDLLWSRIRWRRDLRMSRQDVKDEFKQAEGDPLVKGRLRSLSQDRARRRMLAAVPRATMILANPTHYAIALRYDRSENDAPIVLAKGQDLVALRVRDIARKHGISVIEDKPLARAMYQSVAIDQAIPPEFYRAVANLLVYVFKTRS